MKYSSGDLLQILNLDTNSDKLLHLLRDFKQHKTEYLHNGIIKLDGYTYHEKSMYIVRFDFELKNNDTIWYIIVDNVRKKITRNEYILLTHYVIKCSEVKNLVEYTDELNKPKSFLQRILGL